MYFFLFAVSISVFMGILILARNKLEVELTLCVLALKAFKTSLYYWANMAPTFGQHWANIGPTLGRWC